MYMCAEWPLRRENEFFIINTMTAARQNAALKEIICQGGGKPSAWFFMGRGTSYDDKASGQRNSHASVF